MAYESSQYVKLNATANSDLSTKQYFFVKLVGDNLVDVCTAATDKPIGVLQNAPTAQQSAEVAVTGVSKVSASAGITAATQIGTTAAGQAVALVAGTDTTKFVIGTVVQANSAANGILTAVIDCAAGHRAA